MPDYKYCTNLQDKGLFEEGQLKGKKKDPLCSLTNGLCVAIDYDNNPIDPCFKHIGYNPWIAQRCPSYNCYAYCVRNHIYSY